MNIKNYLIKLLGGITQEEDLKFRKECETFARNHLIGRYGITCFGYGSINGMNFHHPLVIVGGSTGVYNSDIRGLAAAPWVENIVVNSNNNWTPEVEMERHPPFIETAIIDISPGGYSTGAVTSNKRPSVKE